MKPGPEYRKVQRDVMLIADKARAVILQRFFKTGKGEYGEGDIFAGLTVPQVRSIASRYPGLSLYDISKLLKSAIHEERLIALLILVRQFQKGDDTVKKTIYSYYLNHAQRVNNWDLVDLTAPKIVGAYLSDKPKDVLYALAHSKSLWERRIAVLATFIYIGNKQYDPSFRIARILLKDQHDLIHKAVGWMLREIGKRSVKTEEFFLRKYYKIMPRTMLRYAIEKFPEKKRLAYLRGTL